MSRHSIEKHITKITIFRTMAGHYDALIHFSDGNVRTHPIEPKALSAERGAALMQTEYANTDIVVDVTPRTI